MVMSALSLPVIQKLGDFELLSDVWKLYTLIIWIFFFQTHVREITTYLFLRMELTTTACKILIAD